MDRMGKEERKIKKEEKKIKKDLKKFKRVGKTHLIGMQPRTSNNKSTPEYIKTFLSWVWLKLIRTITLMRRRTLKFKARWVSKRG